MAKLFDVNIPAISKHLKNIFESGELDSLAVISKMETTAEDGKFYQTNFYNLDAIIAVGYRVNSKKATQFRIWATGVLREYIIKGFALLDDVKYAKEWTFICMIILKNWLRRVRLIRASERRIYQQVTDIFVVCNRL